MIKFDQTVFYDAIICAKDMETFIGETIENLKAALLPPQTIWVIDDGSSDNTASIAANYADVQVIKNGTNKGKSFSRNLGITSSKAPFIQLIDADDLIARDKVHNQIQMLLQFPHIDAVFGDVQHFIETPNGREFRPIISYEQIPDMLNQLIQKNIYALHSFLFRRSYFEKAGLFDERLVTSQDRELWIRALLSNCKVEYQPGNLAFYRRHAQSTIASQQTHVAYYNALAVSLHADELFLFNNGIYEATTRESLRMLARNANRYLRDFSEVDDLISKAYQTDKTPIKLIQNTLYNFMEVVLGAKITERLLRPKFWLDHKIGRYSVKY
jgi:glycosyltransferase involved in cell wall biosynthesis